MHETKANLAELSALTRRLTTEYAVSRILAEAGGAADTLTRALAVMGHELGWDYCLCWRVASEHMEVLATWLRFPERSAALEQQARGLRVKTGQGLVGRTWSEGKTQWCPDIRQDAGFLLHAEASAANLGTAVCCPITFRGKVIGVLEFVAAAGVEPDRDSLPVLTSLAEQIGQFLDHESIAAALQASEARLRTLFDANIAGVHCSTVDGATVAVNPAMVRMMHFPSRAAAMAYPAERLYFDARDREALFSELRRSGKDANRQLRLRRYDGKEIWVLANTVLIRAADGVPEMNESTLIDITEAKELEQRHGQTSKLEGIGRLAGGVAHDFNNLLTVINGYSDLLLAQMGEGDAQRASVAKIRQAGQRAEGLTRQLLAVSRRQASSPVEMKLDAAVEEAAGLLAVSLGKDVRLTRFTEPGLGLIRADPGHIAQIIMNLALNARDAMPGGGELRLDLHNVSVDADYTRRHVQGRAGPYVRLTVSDTGTGMDEETRLHAFEPFFTTKPRGKGTGLGLATVYGLVLQSGGWIEFSSELGHGTTFQLYFPEVEGAATEATVLAATQSGCRQGETVLLCEDTAEIRELMRELLEEAGYRVTAVANAAEALTAVASLATLDLLITDLILPDQTGVGLVNQLGETRPAMRVLLTSGYPAKAAVQQGLLPPGEQGWAYLQKPFTAPGLVQLVRQCLADRSQAASV